MASATSPCFLSRWRLPRPPRQRRTECRECRIHRSAAAISADASSTSSTLTSSSSDSALFDALASALALPSGGYSNDGDISVPVTSGISPLTGARGLITVRGVQPGERLLAVDRATALVVADDGNGSDSSGCFASQALQEFQMLHGALPKELERFLKSGAVGWFDRLCAFFLWATAAERGPGRSGSSSSPFAAYSKLLPDPENDLGLLLNFEEREAGLLLPKELAAAAATEREVLRRAIHDRWFGSSSSSDFSLSSLGLATRGFESTLDAAALVNSRCFAEVAPVVVVGGGEAKPLSSGGKQRQQALSLVVPLCDFANHASAPSATFRLSQQEEGAFELVATRGMRAGEEVTISYLGGAGNASSFGIRSSSSSSSSSKDSTGMLRSYGFVTPGNPADRLASLARAGRLLSEERAKSSSSAAAAASSAASALLSAASAALASRSRDAAERRRIVAAAASIAEGAGGGCTAGNDGGTREAPPSSSPSSSSSELESLALRVEAEAEDAREAAARAASLASRGDVSFARAKAASSWWTERAELARCGAELLRELAAPA